MHDIVCNWCNSPNKTGHRRVLLQLVRAHGWRVGAELGLCHGYLFDTLLSGCPQLTMIGVDRGHSPDRVERVREVAKKFPERCTIYEETTHDAAAKVADGSLDFVFIDADHSYLAVKDDIACWTPKVRKGGWVTGHDYHKRIFPGVVAAVHEAFGNRVQFPGDTVWAVRGVA